MVEEILNKSIISTKIFFNFKNTFFKSIVVKFGMVYNITANVGLM